MIQILSRWKNVGQIFIVDNNSDYFPLLDWYHSLRLSKNVNVIRMKYNLGHYAPWMIELPKQLINELKCRYYVVTDPDLDLAGLPKDTLDGMVDEYQKLPWGKYDYQGRNGDPFTGAKIGYRTKVGLGIRVDDVNWDSKYFTNMELRYHEQPKINGVQLAPVDTTFALYDVTDQHNGANPGIGGVRMQHPYECRHIPYYFTDELLERDEEYKNYLATCNHSSSLKKRYDGITDTIISK